VTKYGCNCLVAACVEQTEGRSRIAPAAAAEPKDRLMEVNPLFRDREEGGRALADRLASSVSDSNILVLALPRGGVPVGFEVARVLRAELDVFLVRKLGLPGQEELAIGAIASGGVRVLNNNLIKQLRVSEALLNRVASREQKELERRERLYRENRPPPAVRDRTILLVDDGLATGASMLAASRALRPQGAKRIIVAAPVASRQACDDFRTEVDQVICAATPEPFLAVGIWYEHFSQTTDEEVRILLERAARKAVP
jgi:putative phosphoribosyl transferase